MKHNMLRLKAISGLGMLLFFVILCTPAKAQQATLDNAWNNFYSNNFKKAEELFRQAGGNAATRAEAELALSLLTNVNGKDAEGFTHFQNFFHASDNPYAYLFSQWSGGNVFSGNSKKPEEQVKFLEALLADPKANGTLKAMAHAQLASHYERSGKKKDADKHYAQIPAITKWQLSGTFENISASGFDKDHAPIHVASAGPDGKTFSNKFGAPVSWFSLPGSKNNKWIDLTYNFYTGNSIIFAQSFVNSPSDQEVELRIGTSGSLKVWLNDKLAGSEPEERNNDMDTYNYKVKLKKGYNRLLLQIGSSEINRSNFMARITDKEGNGVENLNYTDVPQKYTVETDYTATQIPVFAEEFFKKKIEAEPTKMINYLMLADAYLRNDKSYEARKTLLKAQKMAPKSSYIYTQLIEVYIREKNYTNLKIALEWLKENDPELPLSLSLLYEDEVDKENYEEAKKLLDKTEKLYGVTAATAMKRINLVSEDGKQDELLKLIEDGYKKYSYDYGFVNLKHMLEVKVNKSYSAGISVLKKYLKKNKDESAYGQLASDYFSSGNVSEGIAIYKQLQAQNPTSDGYILALGNIYFQLQNYSTAENYMKDALKIAPYTSGYWKKLAEIYEIGGKKKEAIDAYNKAITYAPNNYDARRSLRKLEEKKDVFEYFKQPDVYQIVKNAPKAKDYEEDNSIVLHEETQRVVYKGGATEEKHIEVIKVFNSHGVDRWKNYNIPYYGSERLLIEKAEVIKADGSKVAAETNENQIVFTGLEVGDAIHVTYKKENYAIGKLASHFSDKMFFTHFFPYVKTKYSLLISPSIKFDTKFTYDAIKPKVETKDEYQLYEWEQGATASMKSEVRSPEMADKAKILYISSFPDWTYISNWYNDLAATKAKGDFEVQETVAEIMKDKENLSQMDKVKEIYTYIVKNIRYSSVSFRQSGLIPQKASKVLNTKIGDCKDVSTLFVAMCREIGVNAELVLVNTSDNGRKDLLLPGIGFNHCIAKFSMDNKDYYIELTSDYLPFNSFYSSLKNAYVLNIKNENEKIQVEPFYLNPPTWNKNIIDRTAEVSIEGSDLVIAKTNYKTGLYAADMRSTYRDIGTKEQEKNMLKAITGEYPNVKLKKLDFQGLDTRGDTVLYNYSYVGGNAITQVSGLNLFILPWASKASPDDFIFEDDRQYPIDVSGFRTSDKNAEVITVNLPAGKKLAELPKSINYKCSVAEYNLQYKVVGNKVIATRELKFTEDFIPLDKIKEFSEFYKKVITEDSKHMAFK